MKVSGVPLAVLAVVAALIGQQGVRADCASDCQANCDRIDAVCQKLPAQLGSQICAPVKARCESDCTDLCACIATCATNCPAAVPDGNLLENAPNAICTRACGDACLAKVNLENVGTDLAALKAALEAAAANAKAELNKLICTA